MSTAEPAPAGSRDRADGLVGFGLGHGAMWGATAALAYVLAYATFVAVWTWFQGVGGTLGTFVLVGLVGLVVGLVVGAPAGAVLGAVIAPLLGRRPADGAARTALRAALLSLVATIPVTLVLTVQDVGAGLVFGLGPAVVGAGGAAGLGRDVARRSQQQADAEPVSPAGSAPA